MDYLKNFQHFIVDEYHNHKCFFILVPKNKIIHCFYLQLVNMKLDYSHQPQLLGFCYQNIYLKIYL